MSDLKDIGDACVACRRDTSSGSGLFVNRIPADDGECIGYMCPECQCVDCERCGTPTFEYYSVDAVDACFVCEDCLLPGEE